MIEKLENAVKIYSQMAFVPVKTFESVYAFETTEHYRKPPAEDYKLINSGKKWGGEYKNVWLKFNFEVPKEYEGEALYLCQNAGAREILAFVNGKPVGMFNQYEQFVSGRHDNILLTNSATPGEQFQIDLECYAWHYEPGLTCYDNLGKDYAKDEEFIKTFENISICTKNSEIYDFICDLKIAIEISRYDRNDFLKAKAINLLEAISPMLCFSLTLTILKRLCKAFARQTICLANYLKEKAMQ